MAIKTLESKRRKNKQIQAIETSMAREISIFLALVRQTWM